MSVLFTDDTLSGALFSACGLYRYRLWRIWDRALPVLLVCMLNPSTADGIDLDPTTKRVSAFARALGYGGWMVVNAFAVKSTDPKGMLAHAAPVGPENDFHLAELAAHDLVLCAWGTKGAHLGRDARVLEIFREQECRPMCLRTTSIGHPEHPLYLPAGLTLKPWSLGTVYNEDLDVPGRGGRYA